MNPILIFVRSFFFIALNNSDITRANNLGKRYIKKSIYTSINNVNIIFFNTYRNPSIFKN